MSRLLRVTGGRGAHAGTGSGIAYSRTEARTLGISRTNILQYPQAPYVPLPDYVLLHSPVAWPDRVITLPTAESYQERKMVRKPSRGAVAQYMRPGKSSSTARALNQLAVDEAVVEPAKRTSIVSRVVQWRQHHAYRPSLS